MCESVTGESRPTQNFLLQTEIPSTNEDIIDIKYEVTGTDSDPAEEEQSNDIDFNFLQCDRNCETCQKYIQKLREHVTTVHGVGGQPIRDPLHIEVTENSSAHHEVKYEVEKFESVEQFESIFDSREKNDADFCSQSEPVDKITANPGSCHQKLQMEEKLSKKYPTESDTVERNESKIRNEQNPSISTSEEPKIGIKKHDALKVHTRAELYRCSICGSSYSRKDNLNKHIKKWHGGEGLKTDIVVVENPYSCSTCGNSYSRMHQLRVHARKIHGESEQVIHTGQKPFKCDECGKRYTAKTYLTAHQRIHTGVGLFTCDVCGKNFTNSAKLTDHTKIHTGLKPFKCEICEKSFSDKSNWWSHVRTHIGDRPHRCEECGRNFLRKTQLILHKRTHTGVRLFGCDECGKKYARIEDLKKHKTRIHSNLIV